MMSWTMQKGLFEWYLSQLLAKRTEALVRRQKSQVLDLPKPDLESVKMAYNHRGILELADVKPIGFLVRSRG